MKCMILSKAVSLSLSLSVGGHHHVYRVVCKQLGEQTLEVVVGNGKTLKNHFPANEKTTARCVSVCWLV